ncbi:hypothetical protein FIBSPDRAFT_907902 [Athelia psychrophila]|uniref:C2H2-type domain-containing protein n=1 Tax=Athelia psychrophila TaxID=1759441 RepID=A0A166TJT0_9AGAM|nr:hypothetical protein FIBSPDRAFT_907902 [Fibularhizoctonia sp. CBS 109695]
MPPLRNLRVRKLQAIVPRPLIPCLIPGCTKWCISLKGLKCHRTTIHGIPLPQEQPIDDRNRDKSEEDSDEGYVDQAEPSSYEDKSDTSSIRRSYHPNINGCICNAKGNFIPADSEPTPRPSANNGPNDWTPYNSRLQFETADFLYRRNQMSQGDTDFLGTLWAASLASHSGAEPPITDHEDLHEKIDATTVGDVPWESFTLKYNGELPPEDERIPSWMLDDQPVWYRDPKELVRNLLGNPDFKNEFDTTPFHEYDVNDNHRFENFMSGDWAWQQANMIAEDPETHGSMFVPIILGSDKTTVSVATGANDYWPVYMSIGNIHNNIRKAHRNGLVLLGFLPAPKSDKEHSGDVQYRKYRRQLFHTALARILQPLKEGMTKPEVFRCPDAHFRRAIFGLGPYIADYPEQCLLACIVQGWCVRCLARNSHLEVDERLPRSREHTNALLEELELGTLWEEYGLVGDIVPFTEEFPRADIHELIAPDILHQLVKGTFKDHLVDWGRGFKQWTGDDSKALMKVYLSAIEGHVPVEMIRAMAAFLDFCYIVRRDVIDTNSLKELEDALERFHFYREIFERCGVRPEGFNLPRQHSLNHYLKLIRAFGAPNGVCSSITESKHIKAIKEPWRRSNRFEALWQMLVINSRLDKLAAARVDFAARGMLVGTILEAVSRAQWRNVNPFDLGDDMKQPDFVLLISEFLRDQLHPASDSSDSTLPPLPFFNARICTYSSAVSTFTAPSDLRGAKPQRQRIHAVSKWRRREPRYDCMLVETDATAEGMLGMDIARARCLTMKWFHGKSWIYLAISTYTTKTTFR